MYEKLKFIELDGTLSHVLDDMRKRQAIDFMSKGTIVKIETRAYKDGLIRSLNRMESMKVGSKVEESASGWTQMVKKGQSLKKCIALEEPTYRMQLKTYAICCVFMNLQLVQWYKNHNVVIPLGLRLRMNEYMTTDAFRQWARKS